MGHPHVMRGATMTCSCTAAILRQHGEMSQLPTEHSRSTARCAIITSNRSTGSAWDTSGQVCKQHPTSLRRRRGGRSRTTQQTQNNAAEAERRSKSRTAQQKQNNAAEAEQRSRSRTAQPDAQQQPTSMGMSAEAAIFSRPLSSVCTCGAGNREPHAQQARIRCSTVQRIEEACGPLGRAD